MESKQSVIYYICNNGFAEAAMAEARKAGARGGTIIHGRSLIARQKEKFLGITIHPEKDILMIVCLNEQTDKLMQAIMKSFGNASEAKGLCFSLDIDESLGFSFDPIEFPEKK